MTVLVREHAGPSTGLGPGRPRDARIEQQVIEATLALIDAEEEVSVAQIVARSGVSRAALYRRWPSLTTLIAAALDVGRSAPAPIPETGNLHDAVFAAMFGAGMEQTAAGYSEVRFRQRIRLVMADRELQRTYWSSHVARRRIPLEEALAAGVARGVLRADLNIAACCDALAGAAYYQLVARGDRMEDRETLARLEDAFEVVWRGMVAH